MISWKLLFLVNFRSSMHVTDMFFNYVFSARRLRKVKKILPKNIIENVIQTIEFVCLSTHLACSYPWIKSWVFYSITWNFLLYFKWFPPNKVLLSTFKAPFRQIARARSEAKKEKCLKSFLFFHSLLQACRHISNTTQIFSTVTHVPLFTLSHDSMFKRHKIPNPEIIF